MNNYIDLKAVLITSLFCYNSDWKMIKRLSFLRVRGET